MVQKKHQKTLQAIFKNPISANIKFKDIEALFVALGADISERAGSRMAVALNGQVMVFHRPHPSPNTDKSAVMSIRKWLDGMGITPLDDDSQTDEYADKQTDEQEQTHEHHDN
ncbi:type II toxin-antitoxin system HicA family toxin [Moraxella bovis]|uniref:type II toxin-antitoxin system HicA family toxin n=1 Tax=Moraxella bovis TaxID=476 RepID=UPI000DC76924|nr:hypothetical protein DQF64_10970 [Moraxella bovis]